MKFGYHNHDFEFKEKLNGQLMYDIILQHTDPNLVVHQLDFGNMYGAGGRAAEWINKYPGRFQSLHVKDEIKAEKENTLSVIPAWYLNQIKQKLKRTTVLFNSIHGVLYRIVRASLPCFPRDHGRDRVFGGRKCGARTLPPARRHRSWIRPWRS
jgi:hypothetical protein